MNIAEIKVGKSNDVEMNKVMNVLQKSSQDLHNQIVIHNLIICIKIGLIVLINVFWISIAIATLVLVSQTQLSSSDYDNLIGVLYAVSSLHLIAQILSCFIYIEKRINDNKNNVSGCSILYTLIAIVIFALDIVVQILFFRYRQSLQTLYTIVFIRVIGTFVIQCLIVIILIAFCTIHAFKKFFESLCT